MIQGKNSLHLYTVFLRIVSYPNTQYCPMNIEKYKL